jgi:uncharacterized membrane protein
LILENAFAFRLITLVIGVPVLYLLDYRVADSIIYWVLLVIVGYAGTYAYVRNRGKEVGRAMRKPRT